MSQLINNYPCDPKTGCRAKDPNQKDIAATGFAAEQRAAFNKTGVAPSNVNPNRNYQDEVSDGDVGSNQFRGQNPKKTKI